MTRRELVAVLLYHRMEGVIDPPVRIATAPGISSDFDIDFVTSDDAHGPHILLAPRGDERRRHLRIMIDGMEDVEYAKDCDHLKRMYGLKSRYHETRDGYLVYHPFNPDKPIRAQWEVIED